MNRGFSLPSWLGILLVLVLILPSVSFTEDKIKIGVPTALTGDAAAFGVDIKNALTLVNEKIGQDKYEFIFEDEKCDNVAAVNAANKLIKVDGVKYALGFPCNSSMLAAASIYERNGVLAISSSATSGDVLDLGKHIFRLFPSDMDGAKLLYSYMAKHHKKIAILTEQNEYPVMMDRSVKSENSQSKNPVEILSEEFKHGDGDLKTLILKLIGKKVEAIFVNANTDTSFISVVKQIRALKFGGALYAAYLPGSSVVLKEIGSEVNGFIFANLPVADNLVTAKGKELLSEFRKHFGEPQSGFPVVPTTFEAFRVFDLAMRSGEDPIKFISTTNFSGGYLPNFHFDSHGAVQGINFEMQVIRDGKIEVLK